MKKEKTVRTYQRKTKSGKIVTVRSHKASYDAAEEVRKNAKKKVGAGSEFEKKKQAIEENPLGFTDKEYKEWYHWDQIDDPDNEAALKVEKVLKKKLGKKAYDKYFNHVTDTYTKNGHKKEHKLLSEEHSNKKQPKNMDVTGSSGKNAAKTDTTKRIPTAKTIKAMDYKELKDTFHNIRDIRDLSNAERNNRALLVKELDKKEEAYYKEKEKEDKKSIGGGIISGNSWTYDFDGGFETKQKVSWKTRHSRLDKIVDKAVAAGWKNAGNSSFSPPDGSSYSHTAKYVSPDGKHLLTHYSGDNYEYMTVKVNGAKTPEEKKAPGLKYYTKEDLIAKGFIKADSPKNTNKNKSKSTRKSGQTSSKFNSGVAKKELNQLFGNKLNDMSFKGGGSQSVFGRQGLRKRP